jgi:hypothetical protein
MTVLGLDPGTCPAITVWHSLAFSPIAVPARGAAANDLLAARLLDPHLPFFFDGSRLESSLPKIDGYQR